MGMPVKDEKLRELAEKLYLATGLSGVIAPLDEKERYFAVADPKERVITRVKRVGERLIRVNDVIGAYPTKVVVYEGPGKTRKYEVTFEECALREPLVVGPATLSEIVAELRANALVFNKAQARRALAAILNAFIEGGRAEVRSEAQPDSGAGSPPEG